eukprot:366399-Chlamydomonas_euryale.AAC.44
MYAEFVEVRGRCCGRCACVRTRPLKWSSGRLADTAGGTSPQPETSPCSQLTCSRAWSPAAVAASLPKGAGSVPPQRGLQGCAARALDDGAALPWHARPHRCMHARGVCAGGCGAVKGTRLHVCGCPDAEAVAERKRCVEDDADVWMP